MEERESDEEFQEEDDIFLGEHLDIRRHSEENCWDRFLKKIPSLDWIFAYRTNQEFRVLDRRLGYTSWVFFLIVLAYFIFYLLILEQQYYSFQDGKGNASLRLSGQLSSLSDDQLYIWDEPELSFFNSQPNTVFIPTTIKITPEQIVDECATTSLPCTEDSDCYSDMIQIYIVEESCEPVNDTNGCVIHQWCPVENDQDSSITQIHQLLNYQDITLLLESNAIFTDYYASTASAFGSTTSTKSYPEEDANLYKVSDILSLSGISDGEVIESIGCDILITMKYECSLTFGSCETQVEFTRIDAYLTGYNIMSGRYYTEDHINYKDQLHAYGIRITLNVDATGKEISPASIILQLSVAIALIMAAAVLSDFVMLNFFSEKNHYKRMKILQTKDFNE